MSTNPHGSAVIDPGQTRPAASGGQEKPTRFRWVICALLFFATTVNYMDRHVLALLKPHLTEDLAWTETQYGRITFAFSLAYMIGLLVVGRLLDLVGSRRGFSLAATLWSLAAMAHAFVSSWIGFSFARFALGVAEAANFPAAIKATAEWFPKKERALATGIFNSGSNVGVVLAALFVPIITVYMGWRWAFILTAIPGFLFVVVWLWLYRRPREHHRVNSAELAHIESDPVDPTARVRWIELIPHRQTWAYAMGKFLTDPVWWFFLFWAPGYFASTFDVKLSGLALPLVVIYIAADIGSIGGGWVSSTMLKRGFTPNQARKTAMLICALCVVPMIFASYIPSMWGNVTIIALAAAAHQGWSANLYTLVSDTFPRNTVSSVVGFGATFGMLSSTVSQLGIGSLLDAMDLNYVPLLTIAGMMYLIALFVIHVLVPRLEPVRLEAKATE